MTPKGSKYLETSTHSVNYSSEALYLNPISSLAYWIRNIFQTTSQFPIFPLCTNHRAHFQVSHNWSAFDANDNAILLGRYLYGLEFTALNWFKFCLSDHLVFTLSVWTSRKLLWRTTRLSTWISSFHTPYSVSYTHLTLPTNREV